MSRIKDYLMDIEEGRSCSMDIAGTAPEYIQRVWAKNFSIEEIEAALTVAKNRWRESYR